MYLPDELRLAVVGLGYVGLPLAIAFSQRRPVLGFDIKRSRISTLQEGHDFTLEVSDEERAQATRLTLSSDAEDLRHCNVFIATVPTPIDQHKRPDLDLLLRASEIIGQALKKGDIVIYESTVYPGATEEQCVPVLERTSGRQGAPHCGHLQGDVGIDARSG
jgi:UDP-N-acetyl-D-galactosamine dehydrogenase